MIVMGLSGGMDSATLLAMLLDQGRQVHCCLFSYGATHGKYEMSAAKKIVAYYQNKFPDKVYSYDINIASVMASFSSNLLIACEREIPEGYYNAENMKKTIVPGRNLIFASILAGLAESIGATKIALGIHSGDHHIYPDCRTEFVKALDSTIYLSSDRKVEVIAPFINDDKTAILQIGKALQVPYALTRTCYKNQSISCGKCAACRERLEAFENCGIVDPVEYEEV